MWEIALAALHIAALGYFLYLEREGFVARTIGAWRTALRPCNMLAALALVLSVVTLTVSLRATFPALNWGWYTLLTGSSGNAGISPFTAFEVYGAVALATMLVFAMPAMVAVEEEIFRNRAWTHGRVWLQAAIFGPAHLIAGVPVSAALSLIAAGAVFGYRFRSVALRNGRKAGLRASGSLHLAYNTWLIGALCLALTASAP